MSSYAFCIRNHLGDLVWAETQRVEMATNNKAEALAILSCLRYCSKNGYKLTILETDSLTMKNILCVDWRIPWELVDIISEAKMIIDNMQIQV